MKRIYFLLFLLTLSLTLAAWPSPGRAGWGDQDKAALAPPGPIAGVDQPLRFGRPGETITFTLTLTNAGPLTATYGIGATANYGSEFTLTGLARHEYEQYPHTLVEVGPDSRQALELGVKIPAYATPGMVHRLETYISSSQSTAPVELQLTTIVSSPTRIERIGHAGLPVEDVFVQGRYAYLAAGREGLRILDISNPTAPVEVGFYTSPTDPLWSAEHVAVRENYAYLAAGPAGLRIIDLADPTRPVEVGRYNEPGSPTQVKLVGEYLYLVWRVCHYPPCSTRLHIVDVSNPANPVQVGLYETVYDLDLAGAYAYLAAGREGVRVLDVSNPAAPLEISVQPLDGSEIRAIQVAGGYAYVLSYLSLTVLDLAEPTHPLQSAELNFFFDPVRLVALAGHLYLIDADGYLVAVDLANPAQPVQVEGDYEALSQFKTAAPLGDSLAYLAAGPAGLRLVDMTNPLAPKVASVFGGSSYAQGVALANGYAYVADHYNGLRILDVTEPARPVEAGFYSQAGGADHVTLKDNYAYVTFGNCPLLAYERSIPDRCHAALSVLDIANPAAPVEVARYENWQRVKFWDGQAYVLDEAKTLHLYDLSNPTAPLELKTVPGQVGDYVLADGYLYLLTPHRWSYTGDSSNPYAGESYLKILEAGSLAELSRTRLPDQNPALTVTVAGQQAYIYWEARLLDAYVKGWLSLNVSDPAAPVLLETGYRPLQTQAAQVAGRYAYLADGLAGLRLLDLADPTNPVEVDAFGASHLALDLALTDGYIYLANGPAGLDILRYTGVE